MKRFAYLPIVLFPIAAGADVTVYFDENNVCDGLCLVKPADGQCCPSGSLVTGLRVGARADATLSEIRVGNTTLFDTTGAIKSDGITALRTAAKNGTLGTDTKITGGYECVAGATKNKNGTCVVENSDENSGVEYIRGDGTPESPSNVNCWRNGKNYCYWNVNITFHSKPEGAPLAGITDQNDGHTLTSDLQADGNWCKEYVQGACYRINMPTAPGYTFRGYYLGKIKGTPVQLPSNMITGESTTDGGAFSVFYPKNTNAQDISVTGHRIVVMDTQEVPIVCQGDWETRPDGTRYCVGTQTTTPINVDVYGAWARNCDAGTNATCGLEIGTNWNTVAGFGKGDVRYNTGCADGYVISGGAGTYNPACVTEKGDDLTIQYNLIDQFGHNVTSNISDGACIMGDLYRLPDAANGNYTLKYLVTGGQNGGWHMPGKNVLCGTNEFGNASPASVTGTACKNICTIGQHYNDLHATCVQMVNGPSLGNLPTPTYMTNGGYYVIDTYHVENLWDGCPTLQCDSGYTLKMDDNGPSCEQDYKPDALECPSGLTPPAGVTVGTPVNTGNQCQYEIECSDSGAVLEHPNPSTVSPTARGGILVCNGTSGCTTQYVQSALNQYSCFKCMSTGFAYDGTLTVGAPTMAPNGVASSHSCRYNVWCLTGQYANQDPVGTVTCYSNDNNGQTPCRTPVGTTYYYNITELINQYVGSCSGTTPPVLDSCPTMTGNTGGPEGNSSSWGNVNVAMTGTPASGCTYTLSCANNYTLVKQSGNSYSPVGGGTATVSCSGNGCTSSSLSSQILEYYCATPDAGKGPGDLQPAFTIDENLTEETN